MMERRAFCKSTLLGGALGAVSAFRASSFAAETRASGFQDISGVKLSGDPTVIPASEVRDFAASLRGRLISAVDPDYDRARRIWNKMIDRRPALIACCTGAADVAEAVRFAREQNLLVAVRGGGHSFPGYSTCNGGLVIDLSLLHGVRVDPVSKTAQVSGGAWIGDLDWESQHYGLATPMGKASNTGVGGLTLGGGYGRLSRLYGLACDNVLSVDLITADGKFLHASATENPDLFWAVRGGGGNFGVVTHFEYKLHEVGSQVLAGELTYAPTQLRQVLEYYGEFIARAPRELTLDFVVSPDEHGFRTPVLVFCFAGRLSIGERLLQSLRTTTHPLRDDVRAQDYVKLQKEADGPPLSDYAQYVKSGYVNVLTSELIDAIVQEPGRVGLSLMGGATAEVATTATAVSHRRELFQLGTSAVWQDPGDNDRQRAAVHAIWDRLSPFASGFYANLTNVDQKFVDDNFGPNRHRLMEIKRKYDPGNLFRLNPNVLPATDPT